MELNKRERERENNYFKYTWAMLRKVYQIQYTLIYTRKHTWFIQIISVTCVQAWYKYFIILSIYIDFIQNNYTTIANS